LGYTDIQDFTVSTYDLPEVPPTISASPTIEGQWIGHTYLDKELQTAGMIHLEIGAPTHEGHFEGHGYSLSPFNVTGRIEPSEGSNFKVSITHAFESGAEKLCNGTLDGGTGIITGGWHFDDEADDDENGPLFLIQTPANLYQFRYTDAEFTSHSARARWSFACAAVLYQVRRRLWSWDLMKAKCTERRRFIDLTIRKLIMIDGIDDMTPLSWSEAAELNDIQKRLATADHLIYDSLSKFMFCKIICHP
jgi:hypothetical protein